MKSIKKKVIFEHVNYEVDSATGTVINLDTGVQVAESVGKDGKRKLFLKHLDGKYKPVDSGLFILWAFEKFYLPKKLWNKATYWFHDEETKNHNPKNLYILHNTPIQFIGYGAEGEFEFFYIPGYELNAINELGQIIRIATGTFYDPTDEKSYSSDEYIYVRINKAARYQTNLLLHRLMAITFNHPPINYPKLHVDHLNGKKNDFSPKNLKWVTPAENIEKAIANNERSDIKTTLVKVLETGEELSFVSAARAASFMGISPKLLNRNFAVKKHLIQNKYLCKYAEMGTEWEELNTTKSAFKGGGVKARNILTGEVFEFKSSSEASKTLLLSEPTIISTLIQGETKFLGCYEFKFSGDESEWSVFPEHKLELARRGLQYNTKVYDLINIVTGVVERHYDLKKLADQLGVIPRNIWYASTKNGTIHRTYKVKEII